MRQGAVMGHIKKLFVSYVVACVPLVRLTLKTASLERFVSLLRATAGGENRLKPESVWVKTLAFHISLPIFLCSRHHLLFLFF